MKKTLLLGTTLMALAGLVSCGGGNSSSIEEKQSAPNYDTVLADTNNAAWVAHGQHLLADGETVNGWNGKDNALYEASKLTAKSINQITAIDATLGATLKEKDVKYLYSIDLIFGVNDAGWAVNFMKDGKKYKGNGSYAFKVAQVSYEAEDEVYAEAQWIPDPRTAHAESLTPSTLFIPTWTEAKDENGFSWADNIACIGGAGKYTVVCAQYSNVSSASEAGFGMALIKTEEKTSDYATYEEIIEFKHSEHTFGVIGSFATSNWTTDIPMTYDATTESYSAEVELAANDEVKVRADGKWDDSWGVSGYNTDNIKVEEAGTYIVTLSNIGLDRSGTVSVAKK